MLDKRSDASDQADEFDDSDIAGGHTEDGSGWGPVGDASGLSLTNDESLS